VTHIYTLDASGSDSVGNLNGSLVNSPTIVTGNVGNAMSFNGTNQYISVPDNPTLRFTASQSFTLSTWVYMAALPFKWSSIVTKSRDVSPWYGLYVDATNHWEFAGPTNVVSTTKATAGVWHLVTAVQDGTAGTRALYVDGVLVGSGLAQAANGSGVLEIGAAASTGEYFKGIIDDVRIYNRALSATEVASVYTFS
jgi:hypothetical protein